MKKGDFSFARKHFIQKCLLENTALVANKSYQTEEFLRNVSLAKLIFLQSQIVKLVAILSGLLSWYSLYEVLYRTD